jgi:hypothetical protein
MRYSGPLTDSRRFMWPDRPPVSPLAAKCLGDLLREQAATEGRIGAPILGRPGDTVAPMVERWADRKARRLAERKAAEPAAPRRRVRPARPQDSLKPTAGRVSTGGACKRRQRAPADALEQRGEARLTLARIAHKRDRPMGTPERGTVTPFAQKRGRWSPK